MSVAADHERFICVEETALEVNVLGGVGGVVSVPVLPEAWIPSKYLIAATVLKSARSAILIPVDASVSENHYLIEF